MNILLATSEAAPFAKTGGLADVCGSLPGAIEQLGHRISVILPAYRQTLNSGQPIKPLGIDIHVLIGSKMVTGQLLESRLPGGGARSTWSSKTSITTGPGSMAKAAKTTSTTASGLCSSAGR